MSTQPKVPAYSRSRQTVVCTECKRLKIKCDRQTPCSGCAKRSNDPRVCVYLTANTERPDIGVLWNNQRESDLKIDSLAVRVDEIQESFLPRKIIVPALVLVSTGKGALTMFPVDPITALWTTTLGIPITRVDTMATSNNPSASTSTARLFVADEPLHLIAAFYDSAEQLPPKQPNIRPRALITPAILNNLPSALSIEPLLSSLNSVLILHPLCSFRSLETRLRAFDTRVSTSAFSVAHFAVAAASMTLASLAYHAERRAWKLPFDVPENERDITRLFDLARLAIRLAGDSDEDQNDVILALLFLIVFALHALELDGHAAVVSGVVPAHIHMQLGQLLDQLRRRAMNKSLLVEGGPSAMLSPYAREQRRMLAGAVAYYDFYVEDLVSNKITIDHASYTTESPATFDDLLFKENSSTIPPPPSGNNTNRSTLFATQRSKILKNLLQARSEVVFGRDQERDLMIAAAEHALNNKPVDDKTPARITPLSSPAGDILHMWDDRLNQQRENLPRAMIFNTTPEYAADIGIVFAGEPRPMGAYEPAMTLSMGYTIAQQTETAALVAYYRMRLAVLLLENTLVYKPRGSPPHSTMNTAIVKALEATQDLVAAVRVQRHVLKKKMPLALSNYGHGKRIFDAGVVFGVLASISDLRNQPRNTTRDAAEGLAQCIELLKDLEAWLRVKDGVSEPTMPQEMHQLSPPIRILEELAERAGVHIEDGVVESVTPRRKRGVFDLEENDESWDGLVLAYVMGGWVVGRPPASSSTSWIGPPEVGSPAPLHTGSFPTLVMPDLAAEEHRNKRACRHPTDAMAMHGEDGLGGVMSFEDPKAKRRTSDGSGSASSGTVARPNSGRPVLAVRARVAESGKRAENGKRPKRKNTLPPAAVAPNGNKVKSESPMDAIDEDFEDRFAFSVTKEPTSEYSYSYASRQPQQPTQHSSAAPSMTQQTQSLSVDSGSANESPCTPQMPPPHLQGYVAEPWSEEGQAIYTQQMMYGQSGLMLSQPADAAYMHSHHHQPPPQQQPQAHHHHQSHQPPPQQQHAQVAQAQQQQHMPVSYSSHGHGHSHRQDYGLHPSHLHYPQSYSGYVDNVSVGSSASGGARPPHPQLVIEQQAMSVNGGSSSQQNSQPGSAVTMDPSSNAFYSGLPPPAVYAHSQPSAQQQQQQVQDQYSQQGWRNPTQEFYATY